MPMMMGAQTREAAVLFSGTDVDDSFLLTEEVSVVFGEGGKASVLVGSTQQAVLDLASHAVTAEFRNAFRLKANQDPAHTDYFYTTFFTGEGACRVPATATAYTGQVESEVGDGLNLKPTDDGLIAAGEAVIVRASQSDVLLMPSCSEDAASTANMLEGSDVPLTLPANSYALSLGQYGVGFYIFSGHVLPANKAYLTLDGMGASSLAFRFPFGDTMGIGTPETAAPETAAPAYNLQGQQVDGNYRGIVVVGGRKVLR